MAMIVLYELKLLPFLDLTPKTWLVVGGAYTSFLLGILTYFTAKAAISDQENYSHKAHKSALFLDGGKKIRFFLLLFSIIGLFASLQHWSVLLHKYGSFANIFLNAQEIYSKRITSEEVKGVFPYLWLFSYFAVFLGGAYSAYKRRVTLLSLIPIVAIVLNESARFTRSGILFGLLEFMISFILFRYYLSDSKESKPISRPLVILTTVVVITITVLGATLVRVIRNPTDSLKGSTNTISKMNTGGIISPSVYFYAASQVGVLNAYLRDDDEDVTFGNSTFLLFYNLLAKFDIVNQPQIFQKGYFIPYWSNTATYLRDLHSDFGFSGPLIFPFLLGLITTIFWFRFLKSGNALSYVILVHLFIVIAISFFLLATRFPPWFYGIIVLAILLPSIEKININQFGKELPE